MEKIRSSYDAVIVGAGTAGCILASRLSEDPKRSVLLIEAGEDYADLERMPKAIRHSYFVAWESPSGSSHDWQFEGRASARGPAMPVSRGKLVGGSSAINAQIMLRPPRADFDRWAECAGPEWSFDAVLPSFNRTESDADFDGEFHGKHGPIPVERYGADAWLPEQRGFAEASRAHGFRFLEDLNHPAAGGPGVGPLGFNDASGLRVSTAVGYLQPARARANLTILPRTLIERIRFDGRRAVELELLNESGRGLVRFGELILCAGAIGTPHLLMRSGVGPEEVLRRAGVTPSLALAGVGRALSDHPMVPMAWRTDQDPATRRVVPTGMQLLLKHCGGTNQGEVYDTSILCASFSTLPKSRGIFDGEPSRVGLLSGLFAPYSRGSVELRSADPSVPPAIDFNYFEDPRDLENMRRSVELSLSLAEDPLLAPSFVERLTPDAETLRSRASIDDWMLHTCSTGHHAAGTCKMGQSDDREAVVDRHGRVHGTERLRVADASIVPVCLRAHTQAATMMIAERIFDFIEDDL